MKTKLVKDLDKLDEVVGSHGQDTLIKPNEQISSSFHAVAESLVSLAFMFEGSVSVSLEEEQLQNYLDKLEKADNELQEIVNRVKGQLLNHK